MNKGLEKKTLIYNTISGEKIPFVLNSLVLTHNPFSETPEASCDPEFISFQNLER